MRLSRLFSWRRQGWELHPCRLPRTINTAVLDGIWQCHCGRRWLLQVQWEEQLPLGEENVDLLDDVTIDRLERYANGGGRQGGTDGCER